MISGAPPSRKGFWRGQWHAAISMVRSAVHLQDNPGRIARGSAAGIFAAFLPIIGQTIAGMAIAWAIRGNLLASIPWSWISNPFTTLPIWYGCYVLGAVILPGYQLVGYHRLTEQVGQLADVSWWQALTSGSQLIAAIFVPALVGSCMIGVVVAVPGYFAVRSLVVLIHARREQRSAAWRAMIESRKGVGSESTTGSPSGSVNPPEPAALT